MERIITAGDIRDAKRAADARSEYVAACVELFEARKQHARTCQGYTMFGGAVRRLARMRAGRRVRLALLEAKRVRAVA